MAALKPMLSRTARPAVHRAALVLALIALALVACQDVTVPPAGQDHPPVIKINNFVVRGTTCPSGHYSMGTCSGDIDQENVSATTTVKVTLGTKLMISGSASNPGGMQQFSLKVTQGAATLYTVQAIGTQSASNTVPDTLSILGSDGAGNAGGKVALVFTMSSAQATVTATASNFNHMTTSITVTYVQWLPPPPPPKIASYTASPNNGYINVGDTATLSWSVANCGATCNVTIEGRDGPTYATLISSFPHRPASGSLQVSPTRSTQTRYTLTATDAYGSDSQSKVIQLYCGPGGPACGPPPSGSVFFFKMTNSQSQVTPCFTLAIYAPDENTAKQLAMAQNGGYTATPITEQDYLNGC